MEKTYDHTLFEKNIYSMWEASGVFTPTPIKDKKPFTIIMPPPNANNPLHIGHARFIAIEDILIRYHRMRGEPTLWLPGADHAGIETQYVFEKELRAKGKSRLDYDRTTLYKMIWDYVDKNKSGMENQLKALGASCDWTRNKFTLDPDITKVVYKTFKKLADENLVYRGKRLVNYCTRCGTAYSNLEVDYIDRKDPLYYMKYGPFTLATVRPETKFGDTAVAVNPKDKRYQKYVGQEIEVEGLLGKFKIIVVADDAVDPEFGTGVVKVTPAHDPVDFEIGQRHGLEIKQVIDLNGRLNKLTGKYSGLTVQQARQIVAEDLKKAGLLVKVDENYQHAVGVCYKCKNTIEPMLMDQWFVKVEPLAKAALAAIKAKKVTFPVKRYEKIANHWLKNLKDWNISRQIVWGVQIPAWYCKKCGQWTITDGDEPEKCSHCADTNIIRDQDTFDTWFSSGQWPFATLQTTKPGDFEYFYPTSIMETAYDILPFWVIRMIMMGLYITGEAPFKEVVIHGLIRDREGQKISKSKGNVIDPIEMTKKYGADALRMAIIWSALIENDIALSEENVRGQRNFANKIWNIARYVQMVCADTKDAKYEANPADKNIEIKKNVLIKKVTDNLDNYRLSEAAEALYDFIWNELGNKYLEENKERFKQKNTSAILTLRETLRTSLILLHPFMPFVTEAIWQENKNLFDSPTLISASWPS